MEFRSHAFFLVVYEKNQNLIVLKLIHSTEIQITPLVVKKHQNSIQMYLVLSSFSSGFDTVGVGFSESTL